MGCDGCHEIVDFLRQLLVETVGLSRRGFCKRLIREGSKVLIQ